MVLARDEGAPYRGVRCEHDYDERAEAIKAIAACMHINRVTGELLTLAHQYEQLGFTKQRILAWLSKFRELTAEDEESPVPSGS